MFVDVHCHMNYPPLNAQLDAVVQKARDARVGLIITAGTNPAANDDALRIAGRFPDIVKVSLGMYPLDALGLDLEPETAGVQREAKRFDVDAEFARMESMADRCVAYGEVGMDFKFTKEPAVIAKQKELFARIIAMAERAKKPLIVHSRNAELECIELLETSSNKDVVMHCFGGRKSLIMRAADNGWFFSVPPVITRLQHFQLLAGLVPLGQLLTETDAPWLGPTQGQTNEPANVVVSVQEIAKARRVDAAVVEEQVEKNARRLFPA